MMIETISYLAVEGPIGVGKTSLAQMFAQDFQAQGLYENPDGNPFLPLFYQDPQQHAFQTQLFFLLSRYRQQLSLKQGDLFQQKVVCDYVFAKDLVFARLNLSPEEFDLYHQVYRLLDQKLPKPDVVVYMQADPQILLKRTRKRHKDYEKTIDEGYILRVQEAYSQYFFSYADSPLLVVNTTGLDFVNQPSDYEMLKKQLFFLLKSGKDKHYVTIDQR